MISDVLRRRVLFFLAICFSLNVLLWLGTHHMQAKWTGVPPVPTKNGALANSLLEVNVLIAEVSVPETAIP